MLSTILRNSHVLPPLILTSNLLATVIPSLQSCLVPHYESSTLSTHQTEGRAFFLSPWSHQHSLLPANSSGS